MPTRSGSDVIQFLRSALLPERAELTDGQLLERFLSRQETAALEALVQRHAPMVWRVCRHVLHDDHDAEDAFQATFLVLVRKAASIRPAAKVVNWLYGVAHQTARKLRSMRAKRRVRETSGMAMPEPAIAQRDHKNDLQPWLDQEISRLPEKYRTVIVLCDLEGKTSREAARQLGCPEGTIGSRLTRARAMLAKRLARHGLVVTGGSLAAMLSQPVARASVPISVLTSTIKTVTLVAAEPATKGLISDQVVALTRRVLKAMWITKLTKAMVLLVVALGGVGTVYSVHGLRSAQPSSMDSPPTQTQKQDTVQPLAKVQKQSPDAAKETAKPASGQDKKVNEKKWRLYEVIRPGDPIRKVKPAAFDAIHTPMKLAEIVKLLGPGWMSVAESAGLVRWTCEDGRKLAIWPHTYEQQEVIHAQRPGQRGNMRMYRQTKGGEENLPIPVLTTPQTDAPRK
jgi:RNA polymerase sigma factor (sigma-70 family)